MSYTAIVHYEEDLDDHSLKEYYNTADDSYLYDWYDRICYDFDITQIVMFLAVYVSLRYVTYNYKKSAGLSSNLISMSVCWGFLIHNDHHTLISYYWYDLILSIINLDAFMTLHHVVSMFALMQCPWHADYESICLAAVYLKSGDVFLHHYKILDALELYAKFPFIVTLYQTMSVFMTIILWTYYRLYKTLEAYPFETYIFKTIAVVFHALNVFWIIKLSILLRRSYFRLKDEFYSAFD